MGMDSVLNQQLGNTFINGGNSMTTKLMKIPPVLGEPVVMAGDGRRRRGRVVRVVVPAGRPDDGRPVVVSDPLRRLGGSGGGSPIVAPSSRTVRRSRDWFSGSRNFKDHET